MTDDTEYDVETSESKKYRKLTITDEESGETIVEVKLRKDHGEEVGQVLGDILDALVLTVAPPVAMQWILDVAGDLE